MQKIALAIASSLVLVANGRRSAFIPGYTAHRPTTTARSASKSKTMMQAVKEAVKEEPSIDILSINPAWADENPMRQAMFTRKVQVVNEIRDLMDEATLIFAITPEGLKVKEQQALVQSMPETTTAKVFKNTLMKIALDDEKGKAFAGVEPMLENSNMWFFVTDDGIKDTLEAITKWSKEFNKKETHFIIGGGMEGELLSQEKVEGLVDLLTKKEAAQAIASSIKGIQAKPARAINSVLSKLARAVKLAAETKE